MVKVRESYMLKYLVLVLSLSCSFGFSITYQEKTDQISEEIRALEKQQQYYEVTIKRMKRTAWRLEFQDPGYSRQLDRRTQRIQQQLDEVNKELAQKYRERDGLLRQ